MANFEEILANLQRQAGFAAGQAREAVAAAQSAQGGVSLANQRLERMEKDLGALSSALDRVRGSGGGQSVGTGNIRYIEKIPGRRIPFDFVVAIPIGNTVTSTLQGVKSVSQDGPFVAVSRTAILLSQMTFARRDPVTNAVATFQGRSFGRYRPASSCWDLMDASAGVLQPITGIAAPGTGAPIVASPANLSGFRTMEFDGLITMRNQGSGWPRSTDPVPSAFYSKSINEAFELGALDFFERGETIAFEVTPTHLANPPAGNLSGYAAGGLYPFLASQYDVHEGINDALNPAATTDPITRLADGILFIVLHGFRIVQPPGPVELV